MTLITNTTSKSVGGCLVAQPALKATCRFASAAQGPGPYIASQRQVLYLLANVIHAPKRVKDPWQSKFHRDIVPIMVPSLHLQMGQTSGVHPLLGLRDRTHASAPIGPPLPPMVSDIEHD